MKLIKTAFVTSTALTLSMGTAAFADNNAAYLDQQGDYNNALIMQNYGGNSGNIAGNTGATSILQDGDANDLYVSQQGSNNRVGSGTFFQRSDTNFGPSDLANKATITQFSDQNTVEKIRQNAIGASLAVGPNEVEVEQGTTLGTGDLNYIRDIAQERGANNYLLIKQTGASNYTYSARQEGNDNDARLVISGNGNGVSGLSLHPDYAGAGGNTGLLSNNNHVGAFHWAAIEQRGTGNRTDLTISGNNNQYAIQNGRYRNSSEDNMAQGLLISGNDNQLGISQVGSRNDVSLSTIAGDFNSIGIVQTVDDNRAQVTIETSFNKARVIQDGSRNNVDHWVNLGHSQTATIDILGDDNQLNTQQRWGNGNQMSVSVTGNRNNAGGTLSGSAGAAFAAGDSVTGLSMSAGSLWQHLHNNQMTMTVTGNDNLFAVLQRGSGNMLNGTVIGDYNQAAVAQNGNNNIANFVQNGSFNNLGIIQ